MPTPAPTAAQATPRRNAWPAYPPRVAHYEFPVFELAKEEIEEGMHGIPYDVEKVGWDRVKKGFEAEHLPLTAEDLRT